MTELRKHYDYVIVGGGTAGVIVAARLAENPEVEVALLEAGPPDEGRPEILELPRWQALLESEYDYDYTIEPQTRGNSRIRHSRARVLGGCSSHNSCIAFIPPDSDLRTWEALGAHGWGPEGTREAFTRLLEKVNLEPSESGNEAIDAFVEAGEQAGYPRCDFAEPFDESVGWFLLNKRGNLRASSSVAYLHPLAELPENLTIITETQAHKLIVETGDSPRVRAVETSRGTFHADREVVLACGAFDTPKLLLLSGIGPAAELEPLGIPVIHDLPGVGKRLLDHPEGTVIWEAARPVPKETSNIYEAGLFARVDKDALWPDLMFHFGTQAFDMQTAHLGYPTTDNGLSLTPNVARAKSEGFVTLRSSDPSVAPVIDFRYFTDPDGYDERIMVEGIKLARELATKPPLAAWIKRELAPGPDVTSDAALSEYARRAANTVYHPTSSCRMGAPDDAQAVVDPQLRVRGLAGLRIADASVFPAIPSVNPAITCMMVGEKCAELMRRDRSS